MVIPTVDQLGPEERRPDPLMRHRHVLNGTRLDQGKLHFDQPAIHMDMAQLRRVYTETVTALKGVGGLKSIARVEERSVFLAKAYALFQDLLVLGWSLDGNMSFVQALQDLDELPQLEKAHRKPVRRVLDRFRAYFEDHPMAAEEVGITRSNVLQTVRDGLISEDDYLTLRMVKQTSEIRTAQAESGRTRRSLRGRRRERVDFRSIPPERFLQAFAQHQNCD